MFKFIGIFILLFPAMCSGLAFDKLTMNAWSELRAGSRLQEDPFQKKASIAEFRSQIDVEWPMDHLTFNAKVDFIYDKVDDQQSVNWERGLGWLDFREANMVFTIGDHVDIKAGRQIISWGTGDLVYLNDLFPKDLHFLAGRDIDYAKAPSDAIRTTLFLNNVDLDLVYTPKFDPDRYVDGRRLSYIDSQSGERAGSNHIISVKQRDDLFGDNEWAARLSHRRAGTHWALYLYDGFWKSPLSVNVETAQAKFSALTVYGLSARSSLAAGVFSIELALYDSKEDTQGTNNFIPNSELRTLIAYETELGKNLTGSVQYYRTSMKNYSRYLDNTDNENLVFKKENHIATFRLTKKLLSQTLTISSFISWSLNQQEIFSRLVAKYEMGDHWRTELGFNLLSGSDNTFYGGLENNTNAFFAVRYFY